MNKKYLHHVWTRIRPIKTRYLLAAFLLFATVSVVALRHNYTVMVDLREAVYRADRENEDVEGALQTLRSHVNSHMNTRLSGGPESVYPPIQLSETFRRLQEAEQARLQATNAELYTQAQQHCERTQPDSFTGGPRIPCIEDYVREHGSGVTVRHIPDALYKFDFASPRWSPDIAGVSLVLSGLLLLAAIMRYTLCRVVRRL